MDNDPQKASTALGVDENVEALLAYVLGWITGLVFLLVEKENRFVRFHAMQSLTVFLAIHIAAVVFAFIPVLGAVFSLVVGPLSLVLWIFLMIKAFQGEKFKLPTVGDFAENQVSK